MNDASQSVVLQAGQYWQAREAMKGEEIRKGDVLLIRSVRDVDNQAHTIILRPHPRWYAANSRCDSEHRFLVQDFLSKFDPCPDYKRIRQAELEKVQGKISELQLQLAEASTNPDAMKQHVDAGIRKWEKKQKLLPGGADTLPPVTSNSTLDASLTTQKVEQMKLSMAKTHEVAVLQAAYIKEKVDEISETVKAMTPFYQEQAAAALATTEDVQTHVAMLLTGVKSLDLYVGTDVLVKRVKKGKDAPEGERLTIMQRKLYMDEELSAWADVGEKFDFNSDEEFFKALREYPSLVSQIFATERCIVCMATKRRERDYGNAWETAQKNEINKAVFLLVRNGENIHVIHSPVESHIKSPRLFPSKEDIDDIFRERAWFGEEGKQITFNDVKYTDKLSEHEALGVHYKRFLILLAGLDHRENLFGTFYEGPKDMKFISVGFQQKYMNFVYDDDKSHLLPEENRPDFQDWAKEKNAYMQSGSRVICMWRDIMNVNTAPGVVKYDWRSNMSDKDRWYAELTEPYGVQIAYREGKYVFVKCSVKQDVYARYESHTRKFQASVNLSKHKGSDIGYICLDAVKADELEWYVYDRTNRQEFLRYIRLFKHAVKYLRAEEKQEAATRAKLMKALEEGKVQGAAEAVDRAIIAWRAAHRGEPLTSVNDSVEFPKLLNQIWAVSRAKADWKQAEEWAKARGLKPLRLVQSGKAQTLALYCAPKPEEEDNRLWPMSWVHRCILQRNKKGFKSRQRSWRVLPSANAAETTLHEWDGVSVWADRPAFVDKFSEKQAIFERVADYHNNLRLFKPMKELAWDVEYSEWRDCRREMQRKVRGRVTNPACFVPFGLVLNQGKLSYLAVGVYDAAYLLYWNAPDKERRETLVKTYSEMYRQPKTARDRITGKDKDYRAHVGIFKFPVSKFVVKNGMCGFSADPVESKIDFDKLDMHMKKLVKKKDDEKPTYWIPEGL